MRMTVIGYIESVLVGIGLKNEYAVQVAITIANTMSDSDIEVAVSNPKSFIAGFVAGLNVSGIHKDYLKEAV